MLNSKSVISIHLCNAYTLGLAYRDSTLLQILGNSTFNLPDGKPLAKILNLRKNVQIRGARLVQELLTDSRIKQLNHLFYGSDLEGSIQLKTFLENEFKLGDNIHCLPAPYLNAEQFDYESIINYCKRESIDFIWIGVGTPKQDYIVDFLSKSTMIPIVIIPIGAVFDFYTGRKREAPNYLSKLGFEWAFRLMTDPKRLAKRYLVYNSIFLILIIKSFLNGILKNFKQFWDD